MSRFLLIGCAVATNSAECCTNTNSPHSKHANLRASDRGVTSHRSLAARPHAVVAFSRRDLLAGAPHDQGQSGLLSRETEFSAGTPFGRFREWQPTAATAGSD